MATTTDVHILVAPRALWQAELRCAYSSVCSQSVSAGFARVSPGLSLLDLRRALTQQLDPDVLPTRYVFLRNVGRHMALVSAWQEERFKVAIFAPPFTSSAEVYLIDAQCIDMRVDHSSLSSPSSSSFLPHAHSARPRAYSLSPLVPPQPPAPSSPMHLVCGTVGVQSVGGARRRAATLDGSELMHHVSAALSHITEEPPVVGMVEDEAQPSDTACATVACSSQESSIVAGPVIGPADRRRRVIENMSQNVQGLLHDSLANDVIVQGLDRQPGPVKTSIASSCRGPEQGGTSNSVSQVVSAEWGWMKGSAPATSTPTELANVPGHCVAPGAEAVSYGECQDGEGVSCKEDLAQSEEEEEEGTQVEGLSVISGALVPHRDGLDLHSAGLTRSHVKHLGQSPKSSVAGEEDETVLCQEEGRGAVRSPEEGKAEVTCHNEDRAGVTSTEEERGADGAVQEKRNNGVTHLEEERGDVVGQNESSINGPLGLKESDGDSVPLCTDCDSEPSFPLSLPLPPIGAEWHQTQAQTSTPDPSGTTCASRTSDRLAVLSGRSTIPSQASGAKEQKWKDLFLSEKKRAASLLARERQLEREQSRLAQQQSKAPVGRSGSKPPSQLTNVRTQLTRVEKDLADLKQRVQLTKLDLAREQQDRQQAGSEAKALRKKLMQRKVPKSGAPGL